MAEGFLKQNGKFIMWFIIVIWVLIGLLFGLQYLDSEYAEENGNKILEDLKLEYGVNDAEGDLLVTCADGSYDVYRPNNSNQLLLCGSVLTDEVRNYMNALE